jgi:hypothetical protein
MESLRKAPMITRVEVPVVAGVPDRRNSLFKGMMAFIAGLLLATGVVCAATLARGIGREHPDLRQAWEGMVREIRSMLRLGRGSNAAA